MQRFIRVSLSLFLFVLIAHTAMGQERKKEFALTVGYASKLTFDSFDSPSRGFHLGVNMYKRNASRFTADAQLSMSYTSDTESSSNYLTINGLYGFRYYFSAPEGKTRIFANLLAGLAFINESGDDFIDNRPDVGYSGGVYLESKQFVFGVSIDAPANLVFKAGLRF